MAPRTPATHQDGHEEEGLLAASPERRRGRSPILFALNAKRTEHGAFFCLPALFVCLVPSFDEGENLFGVALWRNLREDMK